MSKVLEKIWEEFVAILPPTIFFFITLGMVALVRVLMLKGTGIPAASVAQIAIGALILGKAVLISDLLPIVNRYPEKPLAYNVVWKTAIYFLIALIIHYIERLIESWKGAEGLVAANEKLLAEIIWPHFWAINIIVAVMIFDYCVVRELARALGEKKLRQMFFGQPTGEVA